jgi:hypothetical protein
MDQSAQSHRALAFINPYTQHSFQIFKHSPLDLQVPSIRTIRIIEALSPEGYIQCEVRHASVVTAYLCLSYVWGREEEGRWILMNERCFWVRNNLWYFLQSARRKPHIRNEWLWIDALSIDQANNTERNHQVQQMGRIFKGVLRVISWFGIDGRIESYFNYFVPYMTSRYTNHTFSSSKSSELLLDAEPFGFSEYWTRAWVSKFWLRFV